MSHSKEQIQEREKLAQFGLKRCGKCRGVKPRVNFSRAKKRWDGLEPTCRECKRRHRQENADAINEQRRQFREANRERLNEQNRQYYNANRERLVEYRRQYVEENAEEVRESHRRYYWQNREKKSEYNRLWREANTEHRREYMRQWTKTPQGKASSRYFERKRRALKAAVNENFTAEDEAFVFERAGHKCESCGISNEDHLAQFGQRLHLDHILPLSKGHALTPDNCQVLCRSCNAKKGNR